MLLLRTGIIRRDLDMLPYSFVSGENYRTLNITYILLNCSFHSNFDQTSSKISLFSAHLKSLITFSWKSLIKNYWT